MYSYETEKSWVFTDKGQRQLLRIRDKCFSLIHQAGCVTVEKAILGEYGDSWEMLACVDRLVEVGDLREVEQARETIAQRRILTR